MTDNEIRLPKQAEAEAEGTFVDAEKSEPIPPIDIVAYNELRSCADLFRLYENGTLEIQPDFQREVVWKADEQTRFIDSLVKRLPIPSMCFSLDYNTQTWKVIDGLQRMSSIIIFLGKKKWILRSLEDIHPILRGSSNIELRDGNNDQRRIFSTVLDMSIPITVIRCDYNKVTHMQYLFTIFHRLNSGGVRLNNQEIRNCIYSGHFNDALKEFDRKDVNWSAIKKRIWGRTDRFRSIEILLRALAFSERLEAYDGNLAKFLNTYMHDKSTDHQFDVNTMQNRLRDMAGIARQALDAIRGKISLTFIEAMLVAILNNIDTIRDSNYNNLSMTFLKMLDAPQFADAARYAIASEKNVKTRLQTASEIFAGV